ncbi:preprotein translocase subunit YajC [Pararhodospirillum oryzae]|uniref:Sec translocon accessory complex subunit YajC n=1 Tax=Pararhodospirillum oryzae TaxID=478448 RepID=A0A512H6L1_9PROT|nr:preprotein translocase subunit YajC [Pararhodospirillum oryzae]GEO81099.1 preprotein translocase subunit YajC [Pararhodospirillum oryzae]
MFISPAFAESATDPAALMNSVQSFLPLILIFVIFYFLLIRPQQRRMKQHKAMLAAIRRGDKVVTTGGIIGTVAKVVSEQELSLEIAENVRVRVMRDMIANVLSRSEPAPGAESNDNRGGDKPEGTASGLKNLLTKK